MGNETSATVIQVPSGFLITMLEDGRYVPFLIKVREQELIWNDTLNHYVKEAIGDYNKYKVIHPSTYVESDIDGWKCRFNGDLTCEFSKIIHIDDTFELSDFNSVLTGIIKLPTKLSASDGFFPCIVSSCIQEELATASINIEKNITTKSHDENEIVILDDEYCDSFKISIVNSIYRFHENFYSNDAYTGSSYFVTIKGTVYHGIKNTEKTV